MIHQKIERGILHNLWSGRTRDKMTKSFVVHLVILSPPYQTWDLSICLYLNLKHGNLDHLASMAGFLLCFMPLKFNHLI